MRSLCLTISVVLVGIIIFQAGLLERPPFVYRAKLLHDESQHLSQQQSQQQVLYAIVAVVDYKDIGTHVGRLLQGVHRGIVGRNATASTTDDTHHHNNKDGTNTTKRYLQSAALAYDKENIGGESLGVGLYFDNPATSDRPRWAVGFALRLEEEDHPSDDDDDGRRRYQSKIQNMVQDVQRASGLEESVRAVRIGTDHVLHARIPWRNALTPAIAPMLHWNRGWNMYRQQYAASSTDTPSFDTDDDAKHNKGPVALELYVTGANDSFRYIDYIVLMGDTTSIWKDCFLVDDDDASSEEPEQSQAKVEE